MDKRTIHDLVVNQGSVYEGYDCETNDGIILQIHRIKNESSFNVVYFQHGVCDTAHSWIVQGNKSSAIQAHSLGFDVFMGNFRGVFPRKMTQWREKQGTYWDYNIDHLGQIDIDTFIKKIIELKTEELQTKFGYSKEKILEKLKITYIGHSMGGMTLPIYLISKARKNEPHGLYQAILMSPAGFHTRERVTPYLDIIGRFFVHVLANITNHFSVPNLIVDLTTKLKTELDHLPATRDLCSYISSLVVGGASSGNTFIESA